MSTENSTAQTGPPRQTARELADEHVALENFELRERVRDLESDFTTYRALACAALENVALLTRRNRHLADRIGHLTTQIHDLMAAPCLTCRRSERAA